MTTNAHMTNVLVIAAHDEARLDPSTANAVAAAMQLVTAGAGNIDVLVVGHQHENVARQAALLTGVREVLQAGEASGGHLNAETLAKQIVSVAATYAWIVAPHNLLARAALPRAAALCDAAYLSDVVRIDGAQLTRPAYAGAVLTRVTSSAQTFMTVRSTAFEAHADRSVPAAARTVPSAAPDVRTQRTGQETGQTGRPDLGRARIVVAGGRGVGSAENMTKLEALADHLGAALGASRAAVDAGFASNAAQIGQTGKTIAPDLYLALGISGAIQHLAGIKDAKCIVAINKDPDAPIFQIADLGVVADLFEALPMLHAELSERLNA